MKKSTIWIIAFIMGISFAALLYLQVGYLREIMRLRNEQFNESVSRSLFIAARQLEIDETKQGLEEQILETLTPEERAVVKQELKMREEARNTSLHASLPSRDSMQSQDSISLHLSNAKQTYGDVVRKRYVHQRALLNRVIYRIIRESNTKPLSERIDFHILDQDLHTALNNNGVKLAYHIRVTTNDGEEVYRCADYDSTGAEYAYKQILFPNNNPSHMGILYVHFPQKNQYLLAGLHFLIPAIFFTLVLLVIFVFTIYSIFRQKRLTELKNDFINNMTHEFKTPISTISLAAQMLKDPSVGKSEKMFAHISGIIVDETKRLRFQVEKVLQISLFDKRGDTFKLIEVELNSLIDDVANTFRLKVETSDGQITTRLTEEAPLVMIDEMHFTNVLFNLLDNAMKYKSNDRPLHIDIETKADDTKATIIIADNGIGIKRDDLKKIFMRFYRVHTGNRHDVKGFGLGLAYVKNIIDNHKGTIHAESEFGKGTKFIITIPLIKE